MLFKVGNATKHFGSLRRMKMLALQIKDVKTGEELVKIECPCATKRRKKVLRFARLDWLVGTFKKRAGQLKEALTGDFRFMRNYNNKSHARILNIGEGQTQKFSSTLAERLDKGNLKKLVAKSFWQSAATQLVEAGMSIVGLREARH